MPRRKSFGQELRRTDGEMMPAVQAWKSPSSRTDVMKLTQSYLLENEMMEEDYAQLPDKFSLTKGLKRTFWGISYIDDPEDIKELYHSLAFTNRKGRSNAVCKCRKHIDPDSFSTILIGCFKCGKWFHAQCVGIGEDDLEHLRVFDCPKCAEEITNAVVLKKMKEAELARQCRKRKAEVIRNLESNVEIYEGKNALLRQEIDSLQSQSRKLCEEISMYESLKEKAHMELPSFINGHHQGHQDDSHPLANPPQDEKVPWRPTTLSNSSLQQDLPRAAANTSIIGDGKDTNYCSAKQSTAKSENMRKLLNYVLSKEPSHENYDQERNEIHKPKEEVFLAVGDTKRIDSNRILISHHTLDGTFVYSSPASFHMLGYEVEEILNMNLFKLIHPEDTRLVSNFNAKDASVNSNSIFTVKYRLKRKNGTYVHVESSFRPIFCDDFQGFHCVSQLTRRLPNPS